MSSLTRIELLKELEAKLMEELATVRGLLGEHSQTDQPVSVPKKEKEKIKPEGIPKGSLSWESYIQVILKELGGKGKTQDVVQYATKANPKEPAKRVKFAVSGKLSKLYRNKTIGANRSPIKKEGYEFYIFKEGENGSYNKT